MPAPNNTPQSGSNPVNQIPPAPVWGGPIQEPSAIPPPEDKPEDKPESKPKSKPVHPTIPVLVWRVLCMRVPGQVEPLPEKEKSNIQYYLGHYRPGTTEYDALRGNQGAAEFLMQASLHFCDDLDSKDYAEYKKARQAAFSEFTLELMSQLISKEKSNHSEFIEKSKKRRKEIEEWSEESPEYAKREELLEDLDRSVDKETSLLEGIVFQGGRLRKDIMAAARKRRSRRA